MNEQIEKLEHGLMICEATGTELVHIEKEDAEKIIGLLKEQEAVKPVQHLVYTTKGWFCGECDGRLNRLGKYCSFCGRQVKWK